MAERAGFSRLTCIDLEAGKPGVGYSDRIATLMDLDPIGENLELVHGRKRAGARRDVEDF